MWAIIFVATTQSKGESPLDSIVFLDGFYITRYDADTHFSKAQHSMYLYQWFCVDAENMAKRIEVHGGNVEYVYEPEDYIRPCSVYFTEQNIDYIVNGHLFSKDERFSREDILRLEGY